MNNERSCLYENGPGSSRDALLEKLPLRTIEGEWQRSLDMIELSQRRLAHLIQDKQTPVSDKLETCLRDMQAASSRLDRTLNNTTALLRESTADPAVGVAFVEGEGFFSDHDGWGKNCMRMSFGSTPEDLIEEGVRRLGGLICSKLGQ